MKNPAKKKLIIALSVILVASVIFIAVRKKKSPVISTNGSSGGGRPVYTSGTSVNLRKGPGTDSDIVQNVKAAGTLLGTAISTWPDSGGGVLQWVKIQPDATLGVQEAFYVREDLLKL